MHTRLERGAPVRYAPLGERALNVLCLDLEGVLVPEIWEVIADITGIRELEVTTRDVVDYDELMTHRLAVLERHDVSYSAICDAIERIDPFSGAAAFLEEMRIRFQLAILSDTFYEFALPLMSKLGNPFLLCNRMTIVDDRIVGYQLRQDDPKTQAVRSLQSLNFRVVAAGDSFNDIGMLQQADKGIFFNAPTSISARFPMIETVSDYDGLKEGLSEFSD